VSRLEETNSTSPRRQNVKRIAKTATPRSAAASEPTRALGLGELDEAPTSTGRSAPRNGAAAPGAGGDKPTNKPRKSTTNKSRTSLPRQKKARFKHLGRYLRWALLATLLLAVAAAFGLSYVFARVELPPDVDTPPQTSFVYDSKGRILAELHAGEDRVIVPLEKISTHFVNAVIATEDRNFFHHRGVDFRGAARAVWAALRNREITQGGSTITQQYVKLVYTGGERTLARKLKEAVLAVKLEQRHSKEEILELYLNRIYFGRGAYGAEAAARAYFGKSASEIGPAEAALLAGLIRAPEVADPLRAPEVAKKRRNLSLQAMAETGVLPGEEAARLGRLDFQRCEPSQTPEPEKMCVLPRSSPGAAGAGSAAYFVDYVRQYLVEKYSAERVFKGGMRVYTTLDSDLQAAAREAIDSTLDREGDPEAALVALDASGRIVAMIGGRDFKASEVNLAVGEQGGGSGRQPGSAFKPITLAAAVHKGISLKSRFRGPASITLDLPGGGRWTVKNYGGASYGTEDLVVATANSINTIYAQLQMAIGAEATVDMAKRLGIQSHLDPHPSIVLGTEETSPLEMATAYLVFANRGSRALPRAVDKIEAADGTLLEQAEVSKERVLSENEADQINFALQQVIARGTGKAADIGRPAAGKTGTTEDYGDAWFVGYTPQQLSVAVWMGYPEGRERKMTNVHGRAVAGGTFPAQIWAKFMKRALAGTKPTSFVKPQLSGRVIGDVGDPCDPEADSPLAQLDKPACPSPTPTPVPSATPSLSPTPSASPSPRPRGSPTPSPSPSNTHGG
jgi:penicillin-binding protein 1A